MQIPVNSSAEKTSIAKKKAVSFKPDITLAFKFMLTFFILGSPLLITSSEYFAVNQNIWDEEKGFWPSKILKQNFEKEKALLFPEKEFEQGFTRHKSPIDGMSLRQHQNTETLSRGHNEPNPPTAIEQDSSSATIHNPTNISSLITLDLSKKDYQELYESRGQTYRHFYNHTSRTYTYRTDLSVFKPGVFERTSWVTAQEYPVRFFIRNKSGSSYFCTLDELISLFGQNDNSSVSYVGIEGFGGISGFYMNFEDIQNGHGQYLYYPRFINGCLAPYDFPQYQIFPRLSIQLEDGTIQSQFIIPPSDSRNTIHITNESNVLKVWYTFYGANYFGKTFDFETGIKYNLTEHRFHPINHFRCRDADFNDVGFEYEIEATTQARNTGYSPGFFILSNKTHSIAIDISQAWEANELLLDFYSQVEIISENGKSSWLFNFKDMETAGFKEKQLSLKPHRMPDGDYRLVLSAGMRGFGFYTQNTLVEIDPVYREKMADEALDYYISNPWTSDDDFTIVTDSTSCIVGRNNTADPDEYYRGFLAYDTGITEGINSTSNVNMTFYVISETMEDTDTIGAVLYYNNTVEGGYYNETEANNNLRDAFDKYGAINTYWFDLSFWDVTGTGNATISGTHADDLIGNWSLNHNKDPNNRQYIPIKMIMGVNGLLTNLDDLVEYVDRSDSDSSLWPTLEFSYELNTPPNDPTLHADSGDTFAGKTFTFETNHTDDNGATTIANMSLRLSYLGANITIHCPQNEPSGSVVVDEGGGYLIGTPLYSHTRSGVTNGYGVTWEIAINWNWPADDSTYATLARTVDNSSEWSNWAILDTDNEFENDLIISSISYSAPEFPDGIEEGGGTSINDSEWIKGSTDVTCSGVIAYEGAIDTYPESDAADVNLWVDGATRPGILDTELGPNGEFSLPVYACKASTDADYDFNITLDGWSGSGEAENYNYANSEMICNNGVYVDSAIDATNPSVSLDSFSDPDGYFYISGTNFFYGDDMPSARPITASATALDIQTGIFAIEFPAFFGDPAVNDSSAPYSRTYFVGASDTSNGIFTILAYDNVGNIEVASWTVFRDTTAPLISLDSFSDPGSYFHVSGTIFYYGGDLPSTQSINVNASATDSGSFNSGILAVEFPAFFGEGAANDTEAPFTRPYQIKSMTTDNGTFTIKAFDHVGNTNTHFWTVIHVSMNFEVVQFVEIAGETPNQTIRVKIASQTEYEITLVGYYRVEENGTWIDFGFIFDATGYFIGNITVENLKYQDNVQFYLIATNNISISQTDDNEGQYYNFEIGDFKEPAFEWLTYPNDTISNDEVPLLRIRIIDAGAGVNYDECWLYYRVWMESSVGVSWQRQPLEWDAETRSFMPSQAESWGPFAHGYTIEYYVQAADTALTPNEATTETLFFAVQDTTPPSVSIPLGSLQLATDDDGYYRLTLEITDPDDITLLYFNYTTDGGATWESLVPNNTFVSRIHSKPARFLRIYNTRTAQWTLYVANEIASFSFYLIAGDEHGNTAFYAINEQGKLNKYANSSEAILQALSLPITNRSYDETPEEDQGLFGMEIEEILPNLLLLVAFLGLSRLGIAIYRSRGKPSPHRAVLAEDNEKVKFAEEIANLKSDIDWLDE